MDAATRPTAPRRPARERGFALLLVLLLTSIAIVLVTELAFQSSLEHMAAANVSDLEVIEYAVDGQFELALAMLKYDKKQNEVDSEYDEWNSKEKRSRTDEDVQMNQRIFDECGKFNLSRLVTGPEPQQKRAREQLVRILTLFRPEAPEDYMLSSGEAGQVADKLLEYLKREGAIGEVPKPKTSTPGVPLLLDEIVFADPKRLPALLVDVKWKGKTYPGLHRYLTVFGPGKVNLNTAPLVVLESFFTQEDRDAAQKILDRRNSAPEESGSGSGSGSGSSMSSSQNGSSDTEEGAGGNPFTEVNQVNQVEGVTQEILQRNGIDLANDFDVKSDFFAIWIQGSTTRTQRNELYVVERVKSDGFRYLLHQERVDPLLDVPEDIDGDR